MKAVISDIAHSLATGIALVMMFWVKFTLADFGILLIVAALSGR